MSTRYQLVFAPEFFEDLRPYAITSLESWDRPPLHAVR